MFDIVYSYQRSLKFNEILKDPLYKNSFFIYLNNITAAGFGFLFWILAARLYSAEDVGIASALISSAGIIVSLSSFGFLSGLIRFLPKSANREELINSTWIVSLVGAVVFFSLFVGGIHLFSPSLQFLTEPSAALIFLSFLIFRISYTFTYYGNLSLRKADYSFIQELSLGLRILFLVSMTFAGALGIFQSLFMAYVASFLVGFLLLSRLDIHLRPFFSVNALRDVLKFSFANYFNEFLLVAESSIIPIIIINILGAKAAGYYYIAFSTIAPLYAIPYAIFTSMFIEGSFGKPLKQTTIKALKSILIILVPCGIFMYLFGYDILSLFGKEYSENAHDIFSLFIIASIFITINQMFLSIIRISKNIRLLLFLNTILFIATTLLSYYLGMQFGLFGAGLGWCMGQGITAIFVILLIIKNKKKLFFESHL